MEEIQEEPQLQQTEPVIYQGSGVGLEGAGIGGKKRAAKAVPDAAFQPGGAVSMYAKIALLPMTRNGKDKPLSLTVQSKAG